MLARLLSFALFLAATACASANRNASGSSAMSITVRNESNSTIQLYVTEGADGRNMRQLTRLAPSESYRYRGPATPSSQQYPSFLGAMLASGVANEPQSWVSCYWRPPSPVGLITCK
jgi:hypothetical protein